MKVYLAGPVDGKDDLGRGWREELKEDFNTVNFYDPVKEISREHYLENPDMAVAEMLEEVSDSDFILVNLNGDTIGTFIEIGVAFMNDVEIVIRCQDLGDLSNMIVGVSDLVTGRMDVCMAHILTEGVRQ